MQSAVANLLELKKFASPMHFSRFADDPMRCANYECHTNCMGRCTKMPGTRLDSCPQRRASFSAPVVERDETP